jgi:hypothetical protein
VHGYDREQAGPAPSPDEHFLMVELLEIALDRQPAAQLPPPDALPVPVPVEPEPDPVPVPDPVSVPEPEVPVEPAGAAAPPAVPVAEFAGAVVPCRVELSVPLGCEPVELWVEPAPFVLDDVAPPAVPAPE